MLVNHRESCRYAELCIPCIWSLAASPRRTHKSCSSSLRTRKDSGRPEPHRPQRRPGWEWCFCRPRVCWFPSVSKLCLCPPPLSWRIPTLRQSPSSPRRPLCLRSNQAAQTQKSTPHSAHGPQSMCPGEKQTSSAQPQFGKKIPKLGSKSLHWFLGRDFETTQFPEMELEW